MLPRNTIAFVLGGAQCVWADLESARQLCNPHFVVAVNDIGVDYPGHVDHWVSYHSDFLAKWTKLRVAKGLQPATAYWAGNNGPTSNAPKGTRTVRVAGGSSGLLATYAALQSGANRVVLCGVPMDPGMRHYHEGKRGRAWEEASKYHKHWHEHESKLKDHVKSMSGWTATLLGVPTKEWLEN